MTTARLYIFLLTILLVATSFFHKDLNDFHKDLNEYGKWLKFYDLKDENFKQVGTERQENLNWESYNLTTGYIKLYDTLYFYSPDSTYFLDLDSYNVILDKDSKGNLTWFAGDPDNKVQLINKRDLSASTLLFFGTDGFVETAIWRNKFLFEVFGFKIKNKRLIPTIWKYDLMKKTSTEFESTKTFKTRSKNYSAEVRLKKLKQK